MDYTIHQDFTTFPNKIKMLGKNKKILVKCKKCDGSVTTFEGDTIRNCQYHGSSIQISNLN